MEVDGRVKVGLVVPLKAGDGPADAAALKVLEDSSISLGAKAKLENGVVQGRHRSAVDCPRQPDRRRAGEREGAGQGRPEHRAGQERRGRGHSGLVQRLHDAVGVNFNASNGTVNCGETARYAADGLRQSADLPEQHRHGHGWTAIGKIALRVPDSTNPADLLDLDDALPAPDDALKELEYPTDLGDRIGAALLDFKNFGDGHRELPGRGRAGLPDREPGGQAAAGR